MANIWIKKSIQQLMVETSDNANSLKRTLGRFNLIMLGIGGIIGAGIFVLTGQAAANYAGPAIVLSFTVAGFACAFAGLCYAEFASMIPVAGSAYTYAYAPLGEFIAWIIGLHHTRRAVAHRDRSNHPGQGHITLTTTINGIIRDDLHSERIVLIGDHR